MSLTQDPATAVRPWQAVYPQVGIASDLPLPEHQNLAHLIHDHCTRWSRDSQATAAFTCVVPNGMNGSLSFAQVDALSDAFAGYLRSTLGLARGDRVAVQLPNSLSYPVVAFGVLKAGCVLVNTNPLYTVGEMVHQFNNCQAKALVVIDMFADKLPEVMAQTGIQHAVLAGVPEFFPAIPRGIIRGVQKVWSKVLPPVTVPHVRLQAALAQGRASLVQQAAKNYWQDLQPHDLALLQYTGGIIGVETIYGQNTGSFRVMDALTTLAFDFPASHPRAAKRSEFFKRELEQFLSQQNRLGADPMLALGSYAGAMGWPQFIPSSWRRYAVDFDRDGRIDLLNNPVDVIGSVACQDMAFWGHLNKTSGLCRQTKPWNN